MINAGFGLDELAIEAGLHERQRPKLGPLSPPPVVPWCGAARRALNKEGRDSTSAGYVFDDLG